MQTLLFLLLVINVVEQQVHKMFVLLQVWRIPPAV